MCAELFGQSTLPPPPPPQKCMSILQADVPIILVLKQAYHMECPTYLGVCFGGAERNTKTARASEEHHVQTAGTVCLTIFWGAVLKRLG